MQNFVEAPPWWNTSHASVRLFLIEYEVNKQSDRISSQTVVIANLLVKIFQKPDHLKFLMMRGAGGITEYSKTLLVFAKSGETINRQY